MTGTAAVGNLAGLLDALEAAVTAAAGIEATGTPAERYQAGLTVKAARKALSDWIAQGAKPCPDCGSAAIGLVQPLERGGVEFEVGCSGVCKDLDHTDGTRRRHSARGGPMPKHAVEAWNAGPDYWTVPRARPAIP